MILEAKQKEREAERNLSEGTKSSQDGQPCEKAVSSKTPDDDNSRNTKNANKFKHRFSRPTGKTIQIKFVQNTLNHLTGVLVESISRK